MTMKNKTVSTATPSPASSPDTPIGTTEATSVPTDPAVATGENPRPPVSSMARFSVPNDYKETLVGPKIRGAVSVRKPHNQEFIRASLDLRFRSHFFKYKDDRDALYLVEPNYIDAFPGVVRLYELVGVVNTKGAFYFCPVGLPMEGDDWNPWNQSLHEALEHATTEFIRLQSNKDIEAYDRRVALVAKPEPTWPAESLEELLELAFKGKIISGPQHHIVKQLEGR